MTSQNVWIDTGFVPKLRRIYDNVGKRFCVKIRELRKGEEELLKFFYTKPSFAISLYKEYRGKGYGTKLMRAMLELLRSKGYKRASLAVQKANYAVRMYEKVGFVTVDENEEEFIMTCDLSGI